jgi:hypothetical protein
MVSKTEAAYLKIFKFIRTMITKVPQMYVGGFETALVVAIGKIFPVVGIRGCIFTSHKLFGN